MFITTLNVCNVLHGYGMRQEFKGSVTVSQLVTIPFYFARLKKILDLFRLRANWRSISNHTYTGSKQLNACTVNGCRRCAVNAVFLLHPKCTYWL